MHKTAIFPLLFLNLMSPSCSSTPISFKARKFSNSAINKGYIAYFVIAHARNGRIFTSGLKSDIIITFLNSISFIFFGDLRTFKADVGLLNICINFKDLLA